jgi:hypothetical protein
MSSKEGRNFLFLGTAGSQTVGSQTTTADFVGVIDGEAVSDTENSMHTAIVDVNADGYMRTCTSQTPPMKKTQKKLNSS